MAETAGGGVGKTQPQLSEMFQKVALAFKSKTLELFSDEPPDDRDADGVIPDQKVIVLDPELQRGRTQNAMDLRQARVNPLDSQLASGLISSIFATLSSFEASYLQLQHAHAPFDEEGMSAADDSLVSLLKKLSEYKMFYRELRLNPGSGVEFLIGSCLEAQVEDNQSKLRLLGSVSDRLQAEIDRKDSETEALKKHLDELLKSNSGLSMKLSAYSGSRNGDEGMTNTSLHLRPSNCAVVLSVKVFASVLNDTFRATHKFTKIFINLMKRTGWDLDLAASSVYSGVEYTMQRHNRYALLSYVCLTMFKGFDDKEYGLSDGRDRCIDKNDGWSTNGVNCIQDYLLKEVVEHIFSCNPVELLRKDPGCQFSRFCEKKYQELVHRCLELSISHGSEPSDVVLNSWKSLSKVYDSFLCMASAAWALHKLALCFDPVVEIFQVERGADFSLVFMEDVTRKAKMPIETRPKVAFTVVPGFKIGLTVIQSQVYLCCTK